MLKHSHEHRILLSLTLNTCKMPALLIQLKSTNIRASEAAAPHLRPL